MRVIYDGWSLIHAPLSPESLHLLTILENLPRDVQPLVVLPAAAPQWLEFTGVEILPTPNSSWGRLRWEQFHLPSLVRRMGADLLHLVAPTAPALSNLITIFSPAGFVGEPLSRASRNVFERLRASLAFGGMERISRVAWPADLPPPSTADNFATLPPVIPRDFADEHGAQQAALDHLHLPAEFILYQGSAGDRNLERLAQAWNWAAAAIGENYPLLVIGFSERDRQIITALAEQLNFADILNVLPGVTPAELPGIYRLSTAVFHPAPLSPWCGPIRLAMASGKPLVALEDNLTAAITGPAAYLAGQNDARALGAALVTVIVEQEIAERLSTAAMLRAQHWFSEDFGSQMFDLYSETGN
jgi:glycosyltransferase involved in cell wall biosynthesis